MVKPITLAALVAVAACSLATEPSSGALRVSLRPPELLLTNTGARAIYYTVFEANTAALSLWAPCVDPHRCRRVEPDQQQLFPYDSIAGYRPGVEGAIVYWWHLQPKAGGGFTHDSIRAEPFRF